MRYVTAGESHGEVITATVSDVPSGIPLDTAAIADDLRRRASGYGRSVRQEGEGNKVAVLSGVSGGKTTGAPVLLVMQNAVRDVSAGNLTAPRPGHADLPGLLKYNLADCLPVMERASARETAARVAAGCIAKEFLALLDVEISSYVCSIGNEAYDDPDPTALDEPVDPLVLESSPLRCPSQEATARMMALIDEAAEQGDTLGGTFRVVARGVVAGLGGYSSGGARLNAQIAGALASIPSVKAVEIGIGRDSALRKGSQMGDRIALGSDGFVRTTNNAGGIEGGMSNGMPIVAAVACKPLPTVPAGMQTIDLETLEPTSAYAPRADVCVVPAAAVVAEAELACVLATAYQEKFGSDCVGDIRQAVRQYRQRLRSLVR